MNRKKTLFALLLSLGVLGVCLFASAAVQAKSPHMVDDGDLIAEEAEEKLESEMERISEAYQMDMVIVTTDSLGGKTATAYADDYFDYNGYGYGSSHDGILFLLSMEDRDWAISTTGEAISAFTDAGQEYIMEKILPDLKKNDFEEAFTSYVSLCEKFMKEAAEGEAYDVGNMPLGTKTILTRLLIALVIGLVGGGLVTLVLVGQLQSVKLQGQADYYMKSPLKVQKMRTIHLYDNVTRVRKPDPERSGGGHGGSSTHMGSSGTSHGGSSGKF